jgi:hypothetical protein
VDGVPPGVVQRKLGENMPKGVVEEHFADDLIDPQTGKLPQEQQDAVLDMLEKLWRRDVFWEDAHLGNVFLQKMERPDRSTYWRAGISDTDRIDFFSRPRRGGEPDIWIRGLQIAPGANGVASRLPKRPFRSAEEAMLAVLEHKGHLKYFEPQGVLMPTTFDRKLLEDHFPSYRVYPDRSGDAGDLAPVVPFGPRDGPRGPPVERRFGGLAPADVSALAKAA